MPSPAFMASLRGYSLEALRILLALSQLRHKPLHTAAVEAELARRAGRMC